ncbi:MAG: type II toxin-antitoxin system prevent-host-death family antitoxin [Actinomycetota bacterium]|nr:type II toxin-antitoxin system prevent-host-death family antitoxin [Actinomycetota bacterium]
MGVVSIRGLRNSGGEVVGRVEHDETVTVTRDGRPVAVLRPLPPHALSAQVLLRRWHRLPHVDPGTFRDDLDAVLDPRL